jgi:hypothetical protein
MSFQVSKEQFSSKVQQCIGSTTSIVAAADDRLKVSLNGAERQQLKSLLEEVNALQTLKRRITISTKWMDIVGATHEASKNIKQLRGIMDNLESDLHEIIASA